jgi:cell division protein DivIC
MKIKKTFNFRMREINYRNLVINKYFITFVLFFIYVVFFDEHNLIERWKSAKKIQQMEEEVEFYKAEIKATKQKTNELQSDDENLEKFAREQYRMKKDNEDLFIIKE